MSQPLDLEKCGEEFQTLFSKLRTEISKVVVGQDEVIEGVLVALFAHGHVLIEGVPGLGKTSLVRAFAAAAGLKFDRIQFTPDLMPADVIGTNLIVEDEHGHKRFEFEPGPVFSNILLADEINRATPKTQSALLEAMQERQITAGGHQRPLPRPFLVFATQNPLEMEGTYPLPEAQLDRFLLKLLIGYPTAEQLHEILDRTTTSRETSVQKVVTDSEQILRLGAAVRQVAIAREVEERAVRLVLATHPESEYATERARKYIRYGSSPRGAQAVLLTAKTLALADGRFHVSDEDIRRAALPALRHRIILNFEGEAEGLQPESLLMEALGKILPG